MDNYSFCNKCQDIVPMSRQERDGKIYIIKDCPKCGVTETLISSDAKKYKRKRNFMADRQYSGCKLNCLSCEHKVPNIVFIETTNRCNMNCPICITNVPSMGFQFEPKMEFFDRIFKHYSTFESRPSMQLFGGEPTMRQDLFDIIKLARSYGLSVRLVTNGLKLADEEYCNKVLKSGASVLIAFDGLKREMYDILRDHPEALDIKLKALENLSKAKKAKVVLMTVVDKQINSDDMPDFLQYCLKNSHIVRGIFIMPLVHMWSSQRLDYNPERTTPEDVENIVNGAVDGGNVEFVPLGSLELQTLNKILGIKEMPFAGVHPNCESITPLVSDGEKYVSASNYLKGSLFDILDDMRKLEAWVNKKYKTTKVGTWSKINIYLKVLGILITHVNFGAVVGAKGWVAFGRWMKIIGKILIGKKPKDVIKSDTKLKGVLQVMVLPFEDAQTAETERLQMCTSCFSYVDPDDDKIRSIPFCSWERNKNVVMRKIATRFNKEGYTKGLTKDTPHEDTVKDNV